MSDFRVVLASGSPRRKEILTNLGVKFEAVPSGKEEKMSDDIAPSELVKGLAKMKGSDIAEQLTATADKENGGEPVVVIGSDTVVAYGGKVLGKPKGREGAYDMIKMLAGNTHTVFTGVYIFIRKEDGSEEEVNFSVGTEVDVYPMTEAEINAYIDTPEPYDKAGAYAIQGLFAPYIKGVRGDYYTIVGFPIGSIVHELSARGIYIIPGTGK